MIYLQTPSLVYAGIVGLILISEYRNPTDFEGVIYNIIVLALSFFVVTIFNTQYVKNHCLKIVASCIFLMDSISLCYGAVTSEFHTHLPLFQNSGMQDFKRY
jgi:uncharacterized membrane protein